ncbi:MAG: type II toxin-antitoxin system VapC family toxin [Methylococcales bacterium]|nr:type II toxin-antitoxin system VapC family toxin [Methylococcales bacterium]
MNLLLDTHAFIWLDIQPSMLSTTASSLIQQSDVDLFLSIVSIWEMQIKIQLGKLHLNTTLQETITSQQTTNGIRILPIMPVHIFTLESLPLIHKDPFDRLLISQAKLENLALISKDSIFKDYKIPLIW